MIRKIAHLEGVLGYTLSEMQEVLDQKEKNHYHFQQLKGVVKGEKKFRHFFPSKKNLRDLQNRIQSRVFRHIELPPHIHGCVQKRGNMTNAKEHKGKLYKFHT